LTPDRRRELTRRHLLDAAAAEFARQGFHGASLDAVAAAAGFTKGAVYSNFSSKADLFLAVIDDRMASQTKTLNAEIATVDPSVQREHVQQTVADLALGEEWLTLWLEFLLYATRNPEAKAKLSAVRARQKAAVEGMIAGEYQRRGATPAHPVPLLALISLALFDGLDIERLIDPDSLTADVEGGVLGFLFDTIGVPAEGPEPTSS
jgi:AcrR family transcriptional regulator